MISEVKMQRTNKKSEKLPKHWTPERYFFHSLIHDLPNYKESIKKGLPFFTQEELESIKRKYPNSMTWKQIDAELSRKGIIFKKPTFRKYIQEKMIPGSKTVTTTKQGRESLYPSDIIEHINFIQFYYKVADKELFNLLFGELLDRETTAMEAIEANLETSIRNAVWLYIIGLSFKGEDIDEAIYQIFGDDPKHAKFYEKVTTKLESLQASYDKLYNELVEILENYKIPVSEIIRKEGDK
jgi:hypothetical protein